MKKKVAWFSCGASSFLAAYLSKPDEIIYIHIDDQHEDGLRYLKDCEKLLGKEIKILQSRYKTVDEVARAMQVIRMPHWAPCTDILKKRVRKEWELEQSDEITYVWGFDLNEIDRMERLIEGMPEYKHEFPLIEAKMTKQDVHGMCAKLGLKRPKMYDMGYS